MFNSTKKNPFDAARASSSWVPFRVPKITNRENPNDTYALGWNHELADAHEDPTNTNPTKFLEWKIIQSGVATDASHPFKVITKSIDGDQYWGILEKSYAWTSMAPSDQGTVNGLLATDENNDPNWIQISIGNDYLYLEYDQETFETRIFSVGNGDGFNPFINDVQQPENWLVLELDGSIANFKFARKIIAKSEFDGENLTVTQFVRNHQLLQDICFNGNPARYWFDFSKGNT